MEYVPTSSLIDVSIERIEPTPAQIKAVANSLRVRILRLCNDREWTNKQLAERLERDPATILRHLRLLVDAGLIESTGVRQGPAGPTRSRTGRPAGPGRSASVTPPTPPRTR